MNCVHLLVVSIVTKIKNCLNKYGCFILNIYKLKRIKPENNYSTLNFNSKRYLMSKNGIFFIGVLANFIFVVRNENWVSWK